MGPMNTSRIQFPCRAGAQTAAESHQLLPNFYVPISSYTSLSMLHLATHGWGKMLWWIFFIITCRELVETNPISAHLRAFPGGPAKGASWTQEAASHVLGPSRGKRRKSPSSQLSSPQCQSLSWAKFPDRMCWRFLSKSIIKKMYLLQGQGKTKKNTDKIMKRSCVIQKTKT